MTGQQSNSQRSNFAHGFTTMNARAGRAVTFVRAQPSWVTRAALWAIVVATMVLTLVIVVPLLLIAAVVFTVLASLGWIRAKIAGAQRPGASLDGRKNVRVVARRTP